MRSEMALPARTHGGPDQQGVPQFDFSTNSNACGPCPRALAALRAADPTRYPDASYSALRLQLAVFHRVDATRIVLAASASEFIFRITSLAMQGGARAVSLPPHSYGDYAQAARANKLALVDGHADAQLRWSCDPSSPLGAAHAGLEQMADAVHASAWLVLDRAYEPLRLEGTLGLSDAQLQKVWQLWTPNKALGLTGVRAAYAIAPLGAEGDAQAMDGLCPSWPVGTHGVALLQAWTCADVQGWLADSLVSLRAWKLRQIALCQSMGWTVLPGSANFFVCRSAEGLQIKSLLSGLRARGIKLRDCSSFGLPGHVRLGVLPPAAQDALRTACLEITRETI